MARKRLPVRKIREILRLRWVRDLKVRATAPSLGVSHGVVSQTEQRARHRGLDWTAVEGLDDVDLVLGPYTVVRARER